MEQSGKIREMYSCRDDYPRLLNVDEFGFIGELTGRTGQEESQLTKTDWYDLLDKYEFSPGLFREYIRYKGLLQRGIPVQLRGKIWRLLLFKEKDKHLSIHESLQKMMLGRIYKFGTGVKLQIDQKNVYRELTKKTCGYEYQIHVDIQRTFRQHYLFQENYGKGQTDLFNILTAFANRFKKIGYCQGMSDIAAVFLMQYEEAEAYEMMEKFFRSNNLTRLFDNNFSRLQKLIRAQIRMIQRLVPGAYECLKEHENTVEISLVVWYLTLFTRFDIKLCLRIWDYMMFYGFESCMYFVCAIFKTQENSLRGLSGEALVHRLGRIEQEKIDDNEVVDLVTVLMAENEAE